MASDADQPTSKAPEAPETPASRRVWPRVGAAAVVAAAILAVVLLLVVPGGTGPARVANARTTKGTTPASGASTKPVTSSQNPHPLTIPKGQTAITAAQAQGLVDQAFAASAGAAYVATYKMTGRGQVISVTVAQEGSNSYSEMALSSGMSMAVYGSGKTEVNCFIRTSAAPTPAGAPQITPGKSLCMQGNAAALASSPTSFVQGFLQQIKSVVDHVAANLSKYKGVTGVLTTSTMTVLGLQLNCVNIPTAHIQLCFTPQGVVGYMAGQGSGGSSTFELTSYSTTVPAGEFTPPSAPLNQSQIAPQAPSSSTGAGG